MHYTEGNWTVDSLTTDSVSSAKTWSIPDFSYSADFAVTVDEPEEAILANRTASSLEPAETVRFGVQKVKDIYSTFDVDASAKLASARGVQTLNEVKFLVKATNSVSGQEVMIPFTGRVVLRFPTGSPVTGDMIDYGLQRTVACVMATGSVGPKRILEEARGSLIPD